MAKRDLIVMGASAGGVEALTHIFRSLPASLPAAVLVVLHVRPSSPSALPAILARAGKLAFVETRGETRLAPGRFFVAPPDHHMTVRGDCVRLSRGPRINGHRPAVDPLFKSAAREAGPRVIGVVLSGTLDDGTDGMLAVKRAGGATIVQDPKDALYNGMPNSVLEQMTVDHVLPLDAIARALVDLAGRAVPDSPELPRLHLEEDALETELLLPSDPTRPASGFTCPECHGALWATKSSNLERFRCRVGHTFAPKTLFNEQAEALDEAMWAAYRALEESASLAARLAARATEQHHPLVAERYRRKHDEARRRASLIREALQEGRLDTHLEEPNAAEEA